MKGIYLLLMETQAHVAENGAPPDKFGVLYCLLCTEFHGFNRNIDVSLLIHFGTWL